jgi:hypothetical protein
MSAWKHHDPARAGRILSRQAYEEPAHLLAQRRPTRFGLSARAEVPLLGHQPAMPPEQRDQRADFFED